MPSNDDVSVLMIPAHTTSNDRSYVLTTTHVRHSRHKTYANTDKTDILALGWEDNGNTDGTDYKAI